MDYKKIIQIIPTIQAASLLKDVSKQKKMTIDKQLHTATKVLVGSSLIKLEADLL